MMVRMIKIALTLTLALSATAADAQAPTPEGLVPITDPWLLESWGFAPDAANVYATPKVQARLVTTAAEAEEAQRASLGTRAALEAESSSRFGTTVGRTTVDHAAFRPVRSATDHQADGAGGRFCNAGFPFFEGVFEGLPHGARLTAFQFWTFDSSTETILGLALRTCNQDFAAPTMTVLGVYTSFGAGGYDSGVVSPDSDVDDIDGQCTYSIQYRLDDGSTLCSEGNELRLVGAQARWIRQVSPAPNTATFDDVPANHLFFQHIEALVASGITAGCDADSYCPDAPLNRGQMAAFLAKALGL